MIQDRRKFLDTLYNFIYLYAVLIICFVVIYFYYPNFYFIYSELLTYLYSTIYAIFDFCSYIINYVFEHYETAITMAIVIIITTTFYQIFINMFFKGLRGLKR
jgi:hypothetical protein